MKQSFKQSTTATIKFSPPDGPPDIPSTHTPTVELLQPGGGTLQASASATVPGVNTTLNMSSGASEGDQVLTVTTGYPIYMGDYYWLGAENVGPQEQVLVRSRDGASITLAEPLKYNYSNGAAFKGGTLSYSLTTTHTATLNQNYKAIWTYSLNGVVQPPYQQLFDVVKHRFKLRISNRELMAYIPEAMRKSAAEIFDPQDLVAVAESRIKEDLIRSGKRPDLVRDAEQFNRPGILFIKYTLLDRAAQLDPMFIDMLDRSEKEYMDSFNAILGGGMSWYDTDEDDQVDGEGDTFGVGQEENLEAPIYFNLG